MESGPSGVFAGVSAGGKIRRDSGGHAASKRLYARTGPDCPGPAAISAIEPRIQAHSRALHAAAHAVDGAGAVCGHMVFTLRSQAGYAAGGSAGGGDA